MFWLCFALYLVATPIWQTEWASHANRRWLVIGALLLLCLPFVVIGDFLDNKIVADDFYFTAQTYAFSPLEVITQSWGHPVTQNAEGYRPLSTLSYALDSFLCNDNVAGWRVTNLALHGLCSILIFFFIISFIISHISHIISLS